MVDFKQLLILAFYGLIAFSCSFDPYYTHPVTEAPALRQGFDGLAEMESGGWHFEVAQSNRVAFDSNVKMEGAASLKLTVYPGDLVNSGARAETVLSDSDPLHQKAWYKWSFMVPADYMDSSVSRWEILAQWHDQPEDGNWTFYPAHSPMVALHYGVTNGGSGVQLVYGRNAPGYEGYQYSGIYPIVKGKWYTATVYVFWALDTNGNCIFRLTADGTNIQPLSGAATASFNGPNMYNRAPAYLKLGLYRNREITTTNSVYIDGLSRAAAETGL